MNISLPTAGVFTISNLPQDIHNLLVFNSLGEVVYSQTVNVEKSLSINLEKLPMGIYILKILSSNNMFTYKMSLLSR